MRELIGFACDKCKRKNYTSTKNRKTTTEKIAIREGGRTVGAGVVTKIIQ